MLIYIWRVHQNTGPCFDVVWRFMYIYSYTIYLLIYPFIYLAISV